MRPFAGRLARLTLVLALATALLASLGVACGTGTKVDPQPDPEAGANPKPGVVHTPPANTPSLSVTLTEWSVTPDETAVASGPVYFLANNIGVEAHELVVVRSDLAPGALPVDSGRVPEDEIDMVGEISPFTGGSEASIVFYLSPGKYVLLCNIAKKEAGELNSHYEKGMYTSLTVK
jgi:uncharacterized cupredoxin-like copper-binding protein